MKKKIFLVAILLSMLTIGVLGAVLLPTLAIRRAVKVERRDSITIYAPTYSKIDLVCGERPSSKDESIIMICAGAFTGELLEEFRHSNIAGNHVSGGKFYNGYKCRRSNGVFTWSKASGAKFHYRENNSDSAFNAANQTLKLAAKNEGMGVCQEMMIHDGKKVTTTRPLGNVNVFRALCLLDKKVLVIEANYARRFGDFIDELLDIGVTEAIYLDMGVGWNFSWYRTDSGEVQYIHQLYNKYSTNWIVFYR